MSEAEEKERLEPLTLKQLIQQAQEVDSWKYYPQLNDLTKDGDWWLIGDFEVRRRK